MRLARLANAPGAPPTDELIEMRDERLTRRRFLQASAAVAAAVGARSIAGPLSPLFGAEMRANARVAIVGGGVAGLNAAYRLRKAGIRATVYEASTRSGGRMFSRRDAIGPGLVTEFGGEFINTDHEDIMGLVKEFNLPLMDMKSADESKFKDTYFFGGRRRTEAEVIEAFRPIARRIAADADKIEDDIGYRNPGGGVALDRMSLADYLRRVGATGWIGQLLDVAYVVEFGLDSAEQSALNFITLIGTDVSGGFEIVGDSDERYKVRGGNQRIVDALAHRLDGQIMLGHRLTSVRPNGRGFTVSFDRRGTSAADVNADIVILALPFTLLREVDMRVELPAFKRRAIRELGYGTNAKLMYGLLERPWRARGLSGTAYTDAPFQLCWDNSRAQGAAVGGITLYSGGKPGLTVGQGELDAQTARLFPGVERVFPGVSAARSEKGARWHWPTYPFTKASYACYKPGQWTGIRGAEAAPVGNLLFAGEHCSLDYQGFMNGGAETGRLAAEAVVQRLGVRR
jgi:monoamine oxidase